MIRLVFAVIVALVVAIFASQNSEPVHLQFLWWRIPAVSEVLVILLSVLLGVLLAVLVGWWTRRTRPEPRPLMERAASPITVGTSAEEPATPNQDSGVPPADSTQGTSTDPGSSF